MGVLPYSTSQKDSETTKRNKSDWKTMKRIVIQFETSRRLSIPTWQTEDPF